MKNPLPSLAIIFSLATTPLAAQTAGALDTTYNSNVAGSTVLAVAVQPDGKSIIGGSITSVGGAACSNLARLNADGTADPTFTVGTNGNVNYVVVQPDGKILVGGAFGEVNGQPRKHIAQLNLDGSPEDTAAFNIGNGPNGAVLSVAVQPDGKVLLGGQFTEVNGQPRKHVARLNPNGSVESMETFNPGLGPNERVYAVALQADGKILLGGAFREINGKPVNHIARLNADGRVDTTFQPGIGTDTAVRTIAVQADGRILIGGNFTEFDGQPCGHVARLDPNGRAEKKAAFNPGTGANNTVFCLAVQTDGKILLGGNFDRFNGQPSNYVTRLQADGSVDGTFKPGTGANGAVNSVAVQSDGRILLGGAFNEFNGSPRSLVARLNNGNAAE